MRSRTFQPRFGEDRYPIGRFILERSRVLGISRTELVHRLHYRDISSGHRALTEVLLTGVIVPHLAKHLANALEIEDVLVEAVVGATTRQKHDEARRRRVESEWAYRASFRPHLQVQTERAVPSPIFVAALLTVARLRIIALPDEALIANEEARDGIIKTIIIDHGRENGGHVPAFGGINGSTSWSLWRDTAVSISGCPSPSQVIEPVRCRRSNGWGRRLWGRGAVIRV